MHTTDQASAHTKARIAGALWLAVIITGTVAVFLTQPLYVPNDPAATAARLLAAESQFRFGLVANLVAGTCYIGVTVILCDLLRPVSRTLALLTGFFGITGSAVGFAVSVVQLVPLLLLKASYPTGFTPDQLRSFAFVSLVANTQGLVLGMVFFGCQCVTVGYLIARSTFLPRVLGVLLAVGGSTYVIGSLATFLSPGAGARLFPVVMAAAFVGEGSFSLWLLAKGVNLRNWEAQSGRVVPHEKLVTA
jgi:hypothetical protein